MDFVNVIALASDADARLPKWAAERGSPARFVFWDWVKASLRFRITKVVPPGKRAGVPRSAAPNYRQPRDAHAERGRGQIRRAKDRNPKEIRRPKPEGVLDRKIEDRKMGLRANGR